MIYLPDVNVWLAMSFRGHEHHAAAKKWFEQTPNRRCTFCRWTQQAFLRLASNPKALKDEAVSLIEAWRLYDALLLDPRVIYSEEPPELEKHWREYTRRRTFSPKVWSDAYLAAFVRGASLELATFDKGFTQYKNAKCTILS
jgi:toxin-antitoxin system PIN domain toxin